MMYLMAGMCVLSITQRDYGWAALFAVLTVFNGATQ